LTLTLSNPNPFALTQSVFTQSLPANLSIAQQPAPATTCGGASHTLSSTSSAVTLNNANIPAAGSCVVTLGVQGAAVGTYTAEVAAQAIVTAPAGGNTNTAAAALSVTVPPAGGGGGSVTWLDLLVSAGLLFYARVRVRGRA
jgi:hypothetical protein